MGGETSKISKRTGFSPETVRNLRKVYNSLIKKTDLSTADLYLNYDLDHEICDMLFKALDRDGDGVVKFSEFLMAWYLLGPATLEEKIDFCFELYDLKGNGYLSAREYKEASMNAVYTMDSLRNSFDRLLDTELNEEGEAQHQGRGPPTESSTSSSSSSFPPSSPSSRTLESEPRRRATNEAKKKILDGFMETAFKISESLKKEASILEIQQHITDDFLSQAKLDEKGNITAEDFKDYAKQHPEVLMTLVHLRKCLLEILQDKRRRKQRSAAWSYETFSLT